MTYVKYYLVFLNKEEWINDEISINSNFKSKRDIKRLVLNIELYIFIVCVLVAQSCPTLCDPIDGSPPGSAVPGILQARTLEWVAISFSNA